MNIKLMKLVKSEEIITEIVEAKATEEKVKINIKNPLMLISVPGENDQMQLGLAPWIPTSSNREFSIKNDHIVCISESPKELKDHYSKMFGSGLVTPNAEIFVP